MVGGDALDDLIDIKAAWQPAEAGVITVLRDHEGRNQKWRSES